ncbi:MAG: hypothetical protein KC713_04685, partial [Candidatus Omnitrophica bacterium]|nr:hypothetical protein [Candidatus Omnitrophota bacterium]
MKIITRVFGLMLLFSCIVMFNQHPLYAEDGDNPISITLTPGKYISVKGDKEKFRTHHWMKEGFSGGIDHFSIVGAEVSDNTTMDFEGRFFHKDNDIDATMNLTNEELGILYVDYTAFRKYFDNTGGYYDTFGRYKEVSLDDEMHLDIGNLLIKITPTMENFHNLSFTYEHDNKVGTKSRLTWAEVEESASGLTKNIAPVANDISEVTDTFTFEGETELVGYDVKAEQKIERTKISSLRVAQDVADTGTAADYNLRRHFKDPESLVYTTTLNGEQWFDDDTAFVGLAYRYESLENHELENIEVTQLGALSGDQVTNAYATNNVDAHTVVGHYMKRVTPN